jgi:hypothetical protein
MKNLKEGDKMKRKIIYVTILLVLFGIPLSGAQEAPDVDLPDPGTTPDSFLYFLDLALDNLAVALTFNENVKIERSLAIAEERLSEARSMALAGKINAMSRAEKEHGKAMQKIRAEVEEIENSDSEGELKKELEIERKIKTHREKVTEVRDELKVKIKIKGEITPAQESLIETILESLEGQTGEVEIEIKNEKSKTKIKIKQETGEDADEVETRIKDETGITGFDMEKAETMKSRAEEKWDDLLEKVKKTGAETPDKGDFEALIALGDEAFSNGEYEDAKDFYEEAKDLAEDLKDEVEELEEEDEGEEEEEHEIEDDNEDAFDAIKDAEEEIAKAEEDIADAEEAGKDPALSEETLDDARAKFSLAIEAFDSGDYENAEELAEDAKDLASVSRMKFLGKTSEDVSGDDEDDEDETGENDEDDDESGDEDDEADDGTTTTTTTEEPIITSTSTSTTTEPEPTTTSLEEVTTTTTEEPITTTTVE